MRLRILALFLFLTTGLTLQAQSVDQLINKNLEAIGGLPRLMYTDNITFIGSVTIRQGNNSREFIFSQVMTKEGKMLFQLMNKLGSVVNMQGFDGVNAWVGTKAQSVLMKGDARLDFIHNAFLTRFIERDKYARGIKLGSQNDIETELSMTDLLDRKTTITLDNATNQIIKETYRDLQGNFHVIRNSDFQSFDGLILPKRTRASQLPRCEGCSDAEKRNKIVNMSYVVDNVIVNATGIDPKMFERPGG